MTAEAPSEIKYHKKSASLELIYSSGENFSLSAEFLRVHSPSAEVRGHGKGQEVLQTGKRQVKLVNVEPVLERVVRTRSIERPCPSLEARWPASQLRIPHKSCRGSASVPQGAEDGLQSRSLW